MRANNFIGKAVRTALLSMLLVALPASAADPATLRHALENEGVYIHQPSIVEVDGIVIVKGRVADRSSVEKASAVLNRLGLKRVANLLQVSRVPNDEEIRRSVERRLLSSRSLEGCRFNVTTNRGVVRLEGTVREPLQREVASQIVGEIDGVRQIVNDLDLRG